jgi:hypothetical protein
LAFYAIDWKGDIEIALSEPVCLPAEPPARSAIYCRHLAMDFQNGLNPADCEIDYNFGIENFFVRRDIALA